MCAHFSCVPVYSYQCLHDLTGINYIVVVWKMMWKMIYYAVSWSVCNIKGTGPRRFGWKTFFCKNFLFYVRLLCSINFCFGPVEMRQFKNNCSGLKIDWGSPPGAAFTECVLRHYILLFYTNVCRLGLQTWQWRCLRDVIWSGVIICRAT